MAHQREFAKAPEQMADRKAYLMASRKDCHLGSLTVDLTVGHLVKQMETRRGALMAHMKVLKMAPRMPMVCCLVKEMADPTFCQMADSMEQMTVYHLAQ